MLLSRLDFPGRCTAFVVMVFLLAWVFFSTTRAATLSPMWQLDILEMPTSPGQRIQVNGVMKDNQFAPSSVEFNIQDSTTTVLPALPLGSSLLEFLSVRAFGVEERVEVVQGKDNELTIDCRAGSQTAGVLFTPVSARMPFGAKAALRVLAQGDAGFEWGVSPAGKDARLLVPVAVANGSLAADISLDRVATLMPDYRVEKPSPDVSLLSFTIICPLNTASLQIRSIELVPATVAPSGLRAAWVWNAKRWLEAPGQLVNEARKLGLQRLYIALDVPASGGDVVNKELLSGFIAMAKRHDIDIWAVEGDPAMALPSGREHALQRLQSIHRYQDNVPQSSRLGGIQYDIEPYLLPDYRANPQETGRQWAQTLQVLAAQSELKLDMVLPFWLPQSPMATAVLGGLSETADSITIMAYRTAEPAIQQVAEPLLSWGSAKGVPVYVALEAGPLPDDLIQSYIAAEAGKPATLWLLANAGKGHALRFDKPVLLEQGLGYLEAGQVTVPASRISFLGETAAMLNTGRQLQAALRAWASYAGMVFHGLFD